MKLVTAAELETKSTPVLNSMFLRAREQQDVATATLQNITHKLQVYNF
jgi:hypothetical protein